jgi:hypothetical protein
MTSDEANHRETIQLITRDGDNRFSPEVHVLADTLVPIVSTNTWWFSS